MRMLLTFVVWYGIFCFITGTIQPMEWSTTAKVWAVIIGFLVANSARKDDQQNKFRIFSYKKGYKFKL